MDFDIVWLNFVEFRRGVMTYENEDMIIECFDKYYHYGPKEQLDDLSQNDHFEMTEK